MVFATKVAIPAGEFILRQAQTIDFPIRHQARAATTDDLPEFDRNRCLPRTLKLPQHLSECITTLKKPILRCVAQRISDERGKRLRFFVARTSQRGQRNRELREIKTIGHGIVSSRASEPAGRVCTRN